MVGRSLIQTGVVICLLTGARIGVQAQERQLKYHQLEQSVLQHPETAAVVLHKRQALQYRRAAAQWDYLPELSATYRYRSDAIDISDEAFHANTALSVRLSQDLIGLWQVRRGRLRELDAELELTDVELHDTRSRALLEFRKDYLDLLSSRAYVLHCRKLADIYLSLMAIQKTRYQNQEALRDSYLDVEKQYLHYDMLLTYYQRRLNTQKALLAESFALPAASIRWNEITLSHPALDETRLIQLAQANSYRARASLVQANVASGQAAAARFQDLRLAPYIGWNYRGQGSFAAGNRTGAEFGVRFSMPLTYPFLSARKQQHYLARANGWKQEAQAERLRLKEQVTLLYDRYLLRTAQLKDEQKGIAWRQEKLRIQKTNHARISDGNGFERAGVLLEEAEVVKSQLAYQLSLYERDRAFYDLLYAAGVLWPDDLPVVVTTQGSPSRGRKMAIWLWNTAAVLDDADRQEFLTFCKVTGINQVFLAVNHELTSDGKQLRLRELVTQLHRHGVAVSALFGTPEWVFRRNHANLLRRIEFIRKYNAGAEPEARFDAIHLDIEPHALEVWQSQRLRLLRKLAETLALVRAQAPPDLPLEVDLPTFYHKIDTTALAQIIRAADLVTIMAYERSDAASLLKSIDAIVAATTAQNKPFIIGLNLIDFAGESSLHDLMRNIGLVLASRANFKGFAVHDYHRYHKIAGR